MVKILIVDDDLPTCDFLRTFLTKKGYSVEIAMDGETALNILKEKRPHIMLLDIRMPGMSGIEVLRRSKEIHPDLKVIMITAVRDESMIELAKIYGASEYLIKPFDLDYLEKEALPKILSQIV